VPRDERVFLEDIVEACRKIQRFTSGFSFEQFRADEKTIDSVLRNLEVIGEAAKQISAEMRAEITTLDWQRIAGLRDILIHNYFGIDLDIVWDVVQNKVPVVIAAVEGFLRRSTTD
jgi:uncharacterized protein with HEPN domain